MSSPELLTSWIGEFGQQFADRTGLSGVLDAGRVPQRYRVLPPAALFRIASRGRAALRRLCERTGAVSREDVTVRLAVLAVAPHLACEVVPGAPGPDPRVVADVRLFATAVLGYAPGARLEFRPGLVALFPPGFRAVLAVLAEARRVRATDWKKLRGAANPFNAGLGLALLAIAHGAPDVAGVRPDAPLVAWAGAIGWRGRRLEDWKRGLRTIVALGRARGDGTTAAVDPVLADLAAKLAVNGFVVPRVTPRGLAHVILENNEGEGVDEASSPSGSDGSAAALETPADLTAGQKAMLERLRTHAPRFYEFVLCPRVTPTGDTEPLRPATLRHLLGCVDHLLAAYLQLRPLLVCFGVRVHDLRELTPAALLHLRVPAWLLAVAPPTVQHRPGVLASLAHSEYEKTEGEQTVPLLQLLIDRQAAASRALSPTSSLGQAAAEGAAAPLRYTKALVAAARTFQHGFDRWVRTTTDPGTDERAHLDRLAGAARRVARDVAAGTVKGQRFKRPERLLALVTLPQLVCVGLPRLTARLLAAYRAYTAAGRTRDLPRQFTQLLESWMVTSVLVADTLREKNFRHARLYHEIRVSWTGSGPGATIAGVHTTFTGFGGDNPRAALKIKREWFVDAGGRRRRRERVRTHRWSPAVVNPRLLELYLRVIWREADPPNVSPPGTPFLMSAARPGRRLSRKQIGVRVARTLHWVCREVLGRDLEPWDTFRLTAGHDFYGLFGPHVLRALQATYWMGVRERETIGDALSPAARRRLRTSAAPGFVVLGMDTTRYVTELINDTKASAENDYVFLTPEAAARRCTSPDRLPREQRWEHERAYDPQMDLVALGVDIAWHRQVGMPLPPGLRLQDLSPDGAE